jgi:hypothetical protein
VGVSSSRCRPMWCDKGSLLFEQRFSLRTPVRIRVRKGLPHSLVCRKRRLNGVVLRVRPEKPRPPVKAGIARKRYHPAQRPWSPSIAVLHRQWWQCKTINNQSNSLWIPSIWQRSNRKLTQLMDKIYIIKYNHINVKKGQALWLNVHGLYRQRVWKENMSYKNWFFIWL